jgi:hypothetical protein
MGLPNVNNPGVVQAVTDFRGLVAKITQLRNANRLTADQVNNAVAQTGAPNLQALAAMGHLVPAVDSLIDAIIAGQ